MAAAIFEFRLPVTTCSIRNSAAELMNPKNGGLAVGKEFENIGVAFEISLLSHFVRELKLLPVYRPPLLFPVVGGMLADIGQCWAWSKMSSIR